VPISIANSTEKEAGQSIVAEVRSWCFILI